ncbi:MAG: hypothetical protein WD054_01010 [Gemmatimonadota bacterium]
MKFRMFLAVLFAAGLATACASGGGTGISGRSDELTRAEIEASDEQDLLRLIERMRPQWFNSGGMTSVSGGGSSGPTIVIGGSQVGGAEYLRNLPPSTVESIKYWPTAQAANRFGMGHPDGVIEITLRR